MSWPINYLVVVLIVALAAIVLPWLIPRNLRKFAILPTAGALAATILWLLYEQHINAITRPGDPLIRIDLFLIVPLIALDWLSTAVCIASNHIQAEKQSTF